jgi:hypothetical protein
MFNEQYIREKAEAAKKGSEEILNAIDEKNTLHSRSYVVDGVLRIEDALGSLHVAARQMMSQANETEKSYMLRPIGMVMKGNDQRTERNKHFEELTVASQRLINDLDDAGEATNEEGEDDEVIYDSVAEVVLILEKLGYGVSKRLTELAHKEEILEK